MANRRYRLRRIILTVGAITTGGTGACLAQGGLAYRIETSLTVAGATFLFSAILLAAADVVLS